jgi:polysaccharide deacetylase 2 family uncharacterized protein YibQ
MADNQPKARSKKRGALSVRPIFLVAGALALLGFGLISGAALDLATRPPKPKPVAAPQPSPKPSRDVPAPHIEVQTSPTPPSIFDASPKKEPAQPALALNAVPAQPTEAKAVIAIVIDDMGLDRPRALKMISVPGPLTLSLMTYADNLPALVDQARRGGHEIMAHLPMEPMDPKENPGKGALRVAMDEETIRRTIAADLDNWSGYVGVNNHMGSKFTKDRARMDVVMAELKTRGLLWLDSKTIADSSGPGAAKAAGVPFLERDIFLDNIETVEAVTAQLEALATAAKTTGSAIGIGHPYDATYAALQAWLPQLNARGIALVPVTEILKRRKAKETTPP